MKKTRSGGFTLIELLVVMAIITILTAMVVTLVINVRTKAHITKSKAGIELISSAINAYYNDFQAPPHVYFDDCDLPASSDADSYGSSYSGTSLDSLSRNELLYLYLTATYKLGGLSADKGPYLTDDQIGQFIGDELNSNLRPEFIDSWGVAYVFVMPGMDHTGETVDGEALSKPGANFNMLKIDGRWEEDNYRFSLYSLGPNNSDDTGAETGSLGTASVTGALRGATLDGADPTEVGDDLGNWRRGKE